MNKLNLVWKKFNKLFVESYYWVIEDETYFNCVCDCGETKTIKWSYIKNWHTKSCWCIIKYPTIEHKLKQSKWLLQSYDKKWRKWSIINWYWSVRDHNKRSYKHRIIMEIQLWRELTENEHIHHLNWNKLDNRIENLIVLDKKDHLRLHAINNKLWHDRKWKEPINKTSKQIISKIFEFRSEWMYIKDICTKLWLSYPTVQKYCILYNNQITNG